MKNKFALFIIAAMVLGVATGWASNQYLDAAQLEQAISIYGLLTKVFLLLIKMIIAPLVLFTLVAGIGHMEDAAAVGRIGGKALGWFIAASIVSLLLGIVMVEWLQPGAGMNLQTAADAINAPNTSNFTLESFITHMIPSSIIDAMAKNEILQIVVFSVFVGTAIAMLDDKSPDIMRLAEQGASIMLKVTELVMKFAPFAIFGSLAATVAKQGLPILVTYAKFIGGFYSALGVLWIVLILAGLVFVGGRMFKILGAAREPALLAFSTASSEAAYPKLLEGLPKVGVSRKIVSFVLPLGYSFNLDGSMIYCTFATLFIAQAHGVDFTTGQLVMMLFLLLVTSKGIAGVPRASLVVIMATLSYFGLPDAWIAIVLGVDHLLDMGRSATNVVGNTVASAVVAKWEGQLGDPEPETPKV
ncbi:dicarboxylate/amino acid:cation symporter [Asticcacaulis sp. DXS10W]|uniref:Dicarboxylate/amino acid:cation symporter n=1 Tax=Asticcacaulis currens TaxID=2984210 RepID=A0ABT5IFK1_9CAUL|nr:dicarboxylate/amino acid:cation symporter [Asticcacaulis currens]